MKKNKTNTAKDDSRTFAFLPEVVLEHLNDAPTKKTKEISNVIKKEKPTPKAAQTIVFDPLADPFDGTIIEIKPIIKKKAKKTKNL